MENTMPLASIVIVNYNGMDYVDDCLSSVLSQGYPNLEVLFVDNDSTDGSNHYAKEKFPAIRLIQNDRNYGDSKAYNIGIMHSQGEYVVNLNPDAVVEKKWLSELVRAMEQNQDAGACMSKLLFFDERDRINSIGNELSFLCHGWCGGYGEKDTTDRRISEVTYASTTSIILRRKALEEVGLFDESFFLSQEDVDLGLRMRLAGYRILCNPASIVYHKYKFRADRRLRFSERDRLVCLLKVYKKKTMFLIFPAVILVEVAAVAYALKGGWLREKLKTYLHVVRNLSNILDKRRKIQKRRVLGDSSILALMRGGVYFAEVQNPGLSYILNPMLEVYFKALKTLVWW